MTSIRTTAAIFFLLAAPEARATSTTTEPMRVTVRDAKGAEVGQVTLTETPNGVLVRATFRGLPPGERAFHVHQTGRCEAPSFESAGDHLSPKGHSHGFSSDGGPHAGDLPNLMIPSSGDLEIELFAANLRLAQIRDGDGAAVIVHAEADDHRTQPSGAAGARIACGVIGSEKNGN